MSRRFIAVTLLVALVVPSAVTAAARQSFAPPPCWGKIWAVVVYMQDSRIAGARVIFKSGGLRRVAAMNDEYIYEADLPPGTYSLTARASGFCPKRVADLRVEPGAIRTVNVNLNAAAITNVIHMDSGKYVGEEDILVDTVTNIPCALEPDAAKPTALVAAATPQASKASARKGTAKRAGTAATTSARVLNISTQPGAFVWVDEVRRGTADAEGKLQLKLTPGRHSLRVRANGFAERTLALLATQRGAISVVLTKTTDEAELAFQQAEGAREKGNNSQAIELYRQALKLRPRYAAAHLALARALESQEEFDAALEEIAAARRDRPAYAEASAVEGRILRSLADSDGALAAYQRALREGRGFQPEAYAGMGIVHEDKGRNEEAAAAFSKAIAQLSDTEPILYELLGRNLERLERWKEAVAAYEKYLELAPTGAHASAINSIIDQLRKQAAEAEQQQPPL
jgi:Flp pilus assembly protein TadD